ncbi:hypothetical protein EMCRGX_G014440 [Ephydatia muelleri]
MDQLVLVRAHLLPFFVLIMQESMASEPPCDLAEVSRAHGTTGKKYEYLDHTADIQLHAYRFSLGGSSLSEAFEQVAVAMFGYITDLSTVEVTRSEEITAEGHDMESLLFQFLNEFLFLFCAEPFFVAKEVKITEFDKQNFKIRAVGYGETFDLSKHPQGTEVKAITYSNMQIHDTAEMHEVYVIVDI